MVSSSLDYSHHISRIDRDGFTILDEVLTSSEVRDWIDQLEQLFATDQATIKNRHGAVYAARNILAALPACCDIRNIAPLSDLLNSALGSGFGLVRGLYFDKHPDRTWSLPWHKDLTIAVKDNSIIARLPSTEFTKPTTKSGVPHVEAPESVLEKMLTLRIHLDPVTDANGPLEVAIGSHANGKASGAEHHVRKILVNAGDVLAMRPMLSHASGSSDPSTRLHRRILHLEFAAEQQLDDGFEWHQFIS